MPKNIKQPTASLQSSRKTRRKFKLGRLLGVLITVVALGAAGLFYYKYQKLESGSISSELRNQTDASNVMLALKDVLLINETESPTVARVEEPEKLKTANAEFYKDVMKGDYLVVFPRRAIIFRELNNQIINIAPIINTSELNTNTPATPAPTDAEEEN